MVAPLEMDVRTTRMADAVELLLVGAREIVAALSRTSPEGTVRTIIAAAAHRQVESVEAILALVRAGHGSAAVPMLRPSCDELIWIKYLRSLDHADADMLIRLRARLDGFRAVNAQLGTAGGRQMRDLGFSKGALKEIDGALRQAEADMVAMARRLGWPVRETRGGAERSDGPTVPAMAQETGSHELYQFVYGATSRAVHFSPHELLRRVKSHRDGYELTNAMFRDQWSQFALHWGTEILIELLGEVEDEFDGSTLYTQSDAEWTDAVHAFAELGRVPAITAVELGIKDGKIIR